MIRSRSRAHLVALLLALAAAGLAGCARQAGPAPVVAYGRPGSPPPAAAVVPPDIAPRAAKAHPDHALVQSGDTLYGIARRYDVPVRSIIDANGLKPPYRVAAGTSLVLPQAQVHTVQSGETLYSISRLHGVDASTLVRANQLAPPYDVRNGEALALPAPVAKAPAAAAADRPAAPAARDVPQRQVPAPAEPPRQIASVPLPPPPAPAAGGPAPRPAEPAVPAPAAVAAIGAPPAASPPPAAPPVPAPVAKAPPDLPAEQVATLSPPRVGGKGFLWPVQGKVLASYGPGPGGTHNDGINIAAPEGTPVLAADDGEVAYAGNELRGFGWLVLLKHPKSGYTTAYAHNAALLVKRGDRVRRGQPIARVGATGTVGEPQLHFEIRRGTRALDPMEYLATPAATAAAG